MDGSFVQIRFNTLLDSMRVYLTKPELGTEVGQDLLRLCLEITEDGKLDLEEIKALRRWLRAYKENSTVAAVPYLHDIMKRITADGVIDRDELLELHLAVERVIPTAHRTPAIQARQKREAERRDRRRERRQIEREREKEEQKRLREEDRARAMRLRHAFSKVVGVTFPNDDGSERQQIIGRCTPREQLVFQHDPHNKYSSVAMRVLRLNGEQLGHAPEYMAEKILENIEDGNHVLGVLSDVTGGTMEKPTRGANFAAFFVAKDVPNDELNAYINNVLVTNAR